MSISPPSWLLGLAALAAGLCGGLLFFYLSIPLPWVLGSFAATGLLSQLGVKLSMPARWRGYAMLIIGTMLGAGFTPEIVEHAATWLPTLCAMLVLSWLFFTGAFALLKRFSDMDTGTALLAAVPGGLAMVSALAEDYHADVRRIALCHSARLVVLLVMTPFMIGLVSDYDLATSTSVALAHPEPFDAVQLSLLAACLLVGWALARLTKLPSGLMLLPLLLSALLHVTGVASAHVPLPLSVLAQLVIGCGIGIRFQGYRARDILRDGRLAAFTSLIFGLASLAAAWITAQVTGHEIAPLLLAYLPGGAPELGVVALALDIDPAMVATHHVVRVLAIALFVPLAMRQIRKPQHPPAA
ncbi:AbrB family transcriptional regulator [Nitratireductor indicus]|uniref:AbrB family transcriptional regulator n=1 Tax=Nitratireductor indicus TaxID=721133 RepID=UPI002875B89E|nr:AbrB family transcriptional regulator [Nitratireductor indicus]MDS1138061.1 AbrB family transcriptional regulator [Nitratireductor indicus]